MNLVFEGRTWSDAELDAEVERAARGLVARGVRPGDRVAIPAHSHADTVVRVLAVARAGAVLVPMNPELGREEAGYILAHSGATLLGADERLDADAPLPPPPDPDATAIIVYTSGTTATPKGVRHSHHTVAAAGAGFVQRMALTPDDRLLCVLPLFHINGLFYSLGGARAAGATLILAPRFSASRFWRLAAETGATEVNLLAALGAILARRPRSELVPHRIAKAYTAGVAPEIADVLRDELGIPVIIEGYGMTEVPGVAANPFHGPHRRGSFGLPAPGVEARIVDDELQVRSPLVMQGYHGEPPFPRDGWFATGDLVRQDADGYLTFVARKKDIIRRRGENISGAQLDALLARHPDVAEAAAVAVPAPLGEDDILVAVVARPGAALDPAEVRAFCARHLPPARVPRYVAIVPELPHTPSHRVAKHLLRGDAALLAAAVDFGA